MAGALLIPGVLSAAPRWGPGGRWANSITPTPTPTPTPTATSTLYHALDTDFGNVGLQPQSWFDAARADGYEGFITTLYTCWNGEPKPYTSAATALERALTAGMWIGAYGRPVSYWQQSLSSIPAELRSRLKFFALDVEPEAGGTYQLQRSYVDGVRNQFGVRPMVYSGWGMWGDVMGAATSFSDVPLWDFSGDQLGWPVAISDPLLVTYGGWNTATNLRMGWQVQMQSPASFQGVGIDRDVFSRAFIDAV